jgi:hypothetical protein
MTPLVCANFPLAVLFITAFAGIPLWADGQAAGHPGRALARARLPRRESRLARQGEPFVPGQAMAVPQVAASPATTAARQRKEARR